MRYVLYVLLGAAAVLLALLAVCAVRAILIRKKPSACKPAISWTPEEAALYADRLAAMVRVPTVSRKQEEDYPEFLKLQEVMRGLFPRVFAAAESHELAGNILLRISGSAPTEGGGVLLMGHQDVVPAGQKEWTCDPYAGELRDGCVWGRGAMDCKSTVCCEFSAVEELLEAGFRPKEDLWLFSSRNEENSGGGSELAVDYLQKRGVRLRVVMDEGGAIVSDMLPGLKAPVAAIGLVEKGFSNVKFIARGAGGHASTPPRNTPVVRLSKFVAAVEKKQPFEKKLLTPIPEMFDALAPYMPFYFRLILGNMWLFRPLMTAVMPMVSPMAGAFLATTAAFTMSGASDTPNVLPDEAYVIANMRPSVHQNAAASVEALRPLADKYGIEIEVLMSRNASGTSSPKSEEFAFLASCLHAAIPDTVVGPYMMTGGTDSRQFERVCDNVLRFTPTRLTPQQIAAMHAANENIGVEALAEGVKFYRYYLEQMNARF